MALRRAAGKLGRKRPAGKRLPTLLAFTDPQRSGDLTVLAARLPRGSALVYRAFGAPDRLEVGRRLRRITWRRGVLLVVGADVALARAILADGVHLPERLAHGLPGLKGFRLRTVAAHSPRVARRGLALGADAVVLSPILASDSPSAGAPIGVLRAAALVRAAKGAVYGLGGIDGKSAGRVAATGVAGLAAVGAWSAGP
jgi:thiamine-phosphate pyrophosphorylase